MEPYLLSNLNRFAKYVLTRFRFGMSDIFAHSMKYKTGIERVTMCPFCKVLVENQLHFALCCPALDDLSRKYIQPKYYNYPSDFRLTLFLSTKHETTVRSLAIYLYQALKRQRILMSKYIKCDMYDNVAIVADYVILHRMMCTL